MRISEIIDQEHLLETITDADFRKVSDAADIHKARQVAIEIMLANVTPAPRRADERERIMRSGTKDRIIQHLWAIKLSNEGFKTGIGTFKGRKGLGYSDS